MRWVGRSPTGYYWVLAGHILAGVSQTTFMAAPPLLSTMWFPPDQRSVATYVIGFTFDFKIHTFMNVLLLPHEFVCHGTEQLNILPCFCFVLSPEESV